MQKKILKHSHVTHFRCQYRRKGISPLPLRQPEAEIRLYGIHSVQAALKNRKRVLKCLYATQNALKRLHIIESDLPCPVKLCSPKQLDALVEKDAVHQGIVLETKPLKPSHLSELKETDLVVLMDQITDPHNVGAIMRSAVAFKAGALITTNRYSPQENGALAKSASGALEFINYIVVRNLSETLQELHKIGFTSFGLDSDSPSSLDTILTGKKIALILGAEGKGLRKKTRETACALVHLDTLGDIKTLNVSNAAAIALYIARRHLRP